MKEVLDKIVSDVCGYLRINEDLFFCSRQHPRITEAKKYVSYIGYIVYKIPPCIISGYLGVSEKRSSITIDRANSVKTALHYDSSSQTALDIEALMKIVW